MAGPNFWEQDELVGASPARSPQPVLTLPDTRGQAQDSRADAGLENDQARTGIAMRGEGREVENTDFRRVDTLAERYNKLPEVKAYRVSVQMLDQALRTGEGAQADLALTYAFAKAMDPESVVRESEQGMVTSSQPWFAAAVERAKKEFGMDEAGTFTPQARAALRQQIINSASGRNDQYNQTRQYFSEMAGRNGADPFEVVGYHDGKPFMERFQAYTDRQGGQGAAPQGQPGAAIPQGGGPIKGIAVEPEMVGGLPKGTEIQFGMDKTETPFDRGQWLQDTHGITPDQEQMIMAFHNQNRGNQQITPDAVKAWYAKMGIRQPDVNQLNTSIAQMKSGKVQFVPFSNEEAEKQYRANLQSKLNEQGFNAENTDAKMQRIGKGALLGFTDELAGGVNALGALARGEDVGAGYRQGRDVERLKDEQLREEQGIPGYVAEMAGGAMVPMRGIAAGADAAQIARVSAGYGAAAGFGYGEGAQGSVTGAVTGAALGGAFGYGAGRAGEALTARRAASGPIDNAATRYASAQEFGIDPLPGDVGGRGSRIIERQLDVQPVSGSLTDDVRNIQAGQITSAVDNMAGKYGPATSFRGIGDAAQTGAKGWVDKFDRVTGKVYDAIPIKSEAAASTGETVGQLTQLSNKITSNEMLAPLLTDQKFSAYLNALTGKTSRVPTGLLDDAGIPITREMTEGGKLSWQDLKTFRSTVGERVSDNLFSDGGLKSELKALYGALSRDMEATAARQGPVALKAFSRANDFYREGQKRIDDVVVKLLGIDGKSAPEKAAGLIERISRDGRSSGDLKLLADIRKTLKPDEWAQVANGLIRIAGQPANAMGRQFNAQTFVQAFDNMDDAAKNVLFSGPNKPLRAELEKLVGVIRGFAQNAGTRNTSNTAMAQGGSLTGQGLFAGMGAAVGGIPGAIAGVAANHAMYGLTAKAWTNPAFIRWWTGFRKMQAAAERNNGQINPNAFNSQMAALGRVATSNSVIAADAIGLQRQLIEQFGTGPQRLAAQPSTGSSTITGEQK